MSQDIAGTDAGLIDPCPGEQALVLDAVLAAMTDAAPNELEPWRLTDRRLIAELVTAQVRATRAQARWLALLAEAETREATQRELGLPTANWVTNQNTHWARSARDEVRFALKLADAPVVRRGAGPRGGVRRTGPGDRDRPQSAP